MRKSAFLYICLSVTAAAINYLVYPTLAHLLPSSQYVDITVSLSLLTQMATFLSSIIAITVGLVKMHNQKEAQKRVQLLQALLLRLFLIVIVVFLLISPLLMSRLHVPLQFALPICIMMLASIPITIISGYLNGKGLLVKLGAVMVISSGLQFILGTTVATITGSGLLAMLSIAFAQLLAVTAVYRLFRKDNPPKINDALSTKITSDKPYLKHLIIYTIFSSLAVMALNLVQIADLLIVQAANNGDAKFYTDIYVISRVVFFAGMILVWPFLSMINVTSHKLNRGPILKLSAAFAVISGGAIAGLYLFGERITKLLFGMNYNEHSLRVIGTLSITYKLWFLLITAIVLYFIVLRDYLAVWIAVLTSVLIVAYGLMVHGGTSTLSILVALNAIGLAVTIFSVLCFLLRPVRRHS